MIVWVTKTPPPKFSPEELEIGTLRFKEEPQIELGPIFEKENENIIPLVKTKLNSEDLKISPPYFEGEPSLDLGEIF